MARFCKKCGNEIAEGIKFCAKCGTPTGEVSESWVCAACGHENKNGNFCAKCGRGKNGAVTAPFPPQGAAFPEAGQRATPSFSLPGGKWAKLLPVFVVLAVAAYFAVGKFMLYRYDAKCGEIVASMRETKELFDAMKGLSGDPETDGAKQFADGLEQNAEKLKKQSAEFADMTPPEERKDKHGEFLAAVNKHQELVQKGGELVRLLQSRRKWMPVSDEEWEVVKKKVDDWKTACEAVHAGMSLVAPNGDAMLDGAFYDNVLKELGEHIKKREEFDNAYLTDKRKEALERREEKNKALKEKKEVVFLPRTIRKNGDDLVLVGNFYNGTDDMVSGIKDMLASVKLFRMEEEVLILVDIPCNAGISGIWLAPKTSTNEVEIRLPGRAPKESLRKAFGVITDFWIDMHKIHWNVRRAVQR